MMNTHPSYYTSYASSNIMVEYFSGTNKTMTATSSSCMKGGTEVGANVASLDYAILALVGPKTDPQLLLTYLNDVCDNDPSPQGTFKITISANITSIMPNYGDSGPIGAIGSIGSPYGENSDGTYTGTAMSTTTIYNMDGTEKIYPNITAKSTSNISLTYAYSSSAFMLVFGSINSLMYYLSCSKETPVSCTIEIYLPYNP